jgi:uncharacterized protein (TIGR00251 family)
VSDLQASAAVKIGAGGVLTISLHVQPGARRTELVGLHGEALKLRLAAPPVDGKANACLVSFLADFLDVPKGTITLVSGESSRQKRVRIESASNEAVARLMAAAK